MENHLYKIKSALFGLAVGDALGVPVEFKSRETIRKNPVTDMVGYGTYNLPPGTWSDDSSMAFCLAEALTHGFDLEIIAGNFIKWLTESYWTPAGYVFDVGMSTQEAIQRLLQGTKPVAAGGSTEYDNGNGSLMRILPLIFYIRQKPINERFDCIQQVSSVTHAHIRSVLACFYYLEFARQLLNGADKFTIYESLKEDVQQYANSISVGSKEIELFNRLLKGNIAALSESEIRSTGYVVHTLEAGIWCLLTTGSYKEAVLKAVNLGEDTDTTAAVTGGLAGLLYGFESIPEHWVSQLARKEDIENLAERFAISLLQPAS